MEAPQIAVDTSEKSKECVPVLGGLARLTLADSDRPLPVDRQQWLILPLARSFADCTATLPQFPADPPRKPQPPRKTKDVRPSYPADMQSQRIEGMVFIEGTITADGCIGAARVLLSPAVGLSLEALRSVSGWRFDPAVLDGEKIPVRMVLTVNFDLR